MTYSLSSSVCWTAAAAGQHRVSGQLLGRLMMRAMQ